MSLPLTRVLIHFIKYIEVLFFPGSTKVCLFILSFHHDVSPYSYVSNRQLLRVAM